MEKEKEIIKSINSLISNLDINKDNISDTYHTFKELYDHRIVLFIALCRCLEGTDHDAWRTIKHSDNTIWKGWFVLGLGKEPGKQITYPLPIELWDKCKFAETLDKAPEFDGHTSADVLTRLRDLC